MVDVRWRKDSAELRSDNAISQHCLYLWFRILVLLFILPIAAWGEKPISSCEEEVTNNMKFKIIKDSLEQVKTLYPNCRDSDEDSTKCGKKETALAYMNLALDTLIGYKGNRETGETKKCPKCPDPINLSGPIDCSEILKSGNNKSGVYTIYPRSRVNGTKALKVFCDMETDGGGWTVIQRRGNYSTLENFHVGWEDYKKGFGSIERDFWLGNDNIYTLTNQGVYSLRMDMKNNAGEYRYSFHDSFWISNEEMAYALRVRGFQGNVSDDLITQDGMKFSTKDRQNDGHNANDACADIFHGAWWYSPALGCGFVNFNGLYIPGVNNRNSAWLWRWTGYVGLFFTEMKIRHRSAEV